MLKQKQFPMPPKDITGYNSSQKMKDEMNTVTQLSQLACPPTSVITQPHQPQSQTRPPSYSEPGRQHFNDYPSLNSMITPSSGSSHSGSYHQQGTMGSIPASNTMGSAVSHPSYFAHTTIPTSQVNGQQRMPVGPSYHQQIPTSARDDQRHPMPGKTTPTLSAPSFTHAQPSGRPTHMQSGPSSAVPVQQHPQHDAYHDHRALSQRQQSQLPYSTYQHHSSPPYSQISGSLPFVQSKPELQTMGPRSTSAPLTTSMSAIHSSSTPSVQPAVAPRSPQTQDTSVPPPRFVPIYDRDTIEQRITGYYSKQSSDFASLIKLIQDSSAEYSCVFSDSLVADLIGASSLSSPSQGHLRAIGLTIQHMLTCVLEKAYELSVATNPEGSSILTDADVKNALTVLGFTSLAN